MEADATSGDVFAEEAGFLGTCTYGVVNIN